MSDNKTYTCQYCDTFNEQHQYNRKGYFKHIKTRRHKDMYNAYTSNHLKCVYKRLQNGSKRFCKGGSKARKTVKAYDNLVTALSNEEMKRIIPGHKDDVKK